MLKKLLPHSPPSSLPVGVILIKIKASYGIEKRDQRMPRDAQRFLCLWQSNLRNMPAIISCPSTGQNVSHKRQAANSSRWRQGQHVARMQDQVSLLWKQRAQCQSACGYAHSLNKGEWRKAKGDSLGATALPAKLGINAAFKIYDIYSTRQGHDQRPRPKPKRRRRPRWKPRQTETAAMRRDILERGSPLVGVHFAFCISAIWLKEPWAKVAITTMAGPMSHRCG